MACLLYCVTRPGEAVPLARGVCGSTVCSRELGRLRLYWSEIENSDACFGDAESLRRTAFEFHQVLREILAKTTPIPFRFPALVTEEEAIEQHIAAEQALYSEALDRIGEAVQYEIVGSWAPGEQADFATPVSGKEYLKRRQETMRRTAAIEAKLKSVAGESVREWRSRQERRSHRWFALVPREHREKFLTALRSAGPSEGVRLKLTGPWPPIEFVRPGGEHG